MELFLDDCKVDAAPDPGASLEELPTDMRQRLGDTDRIIVAVRCDGIDLVNEELAANMPRSVATFDRIEMHSAQPAALVCEALDSADQLLEASADWAGEAADLLTQGACSAAMDKLGQCCLAWQRVHLAIAQGIEMIGVEPGKLAGEGSDWRQLLSTPSAFLQQIKDALSSRDFVSVADVLSYELQPALDAWRRLTERVRQSTSPEHLSTNESR